MTHVPSADPDPSAQPERAVPVRALALSLAALAVPLVVWLVLPDFAAGDTGLLVWLTCLIPAFLLSYHRGWKGTALALAAGMAVLSLWHAVLAVSQAPMPDWRFVLPVVAVYLATSLGVGALSSVLRRQEAAADRVALSDGLTGLPNRRHTQIALDASHTGARGGAPLSILLIDVDRLRWLNDEHGHQAGDQVLLEVAGLLRRSLLDGELVGRWGGGEFLIVLPGVPEEQAVARAEALRRAVRDAPLRWQPVTVSVGVAAHGPHLGTSDALVGAANDALRDAKAGGGDRTTVHRFQGAAEAGLAVRDAAGVGTPPAPALAPGGPSEANGRSSAARIVVVDDEIPNLRAFGRGLRALGFSNVETFQDPAEALASMQASPPDLVLLDLAMPGMDGFEVLARLRPLMDEEGFLPVVILTGERSPEIRERALRLGGKDFLNKPVDLTELEARILNLLETRSLHLALRDARDRLEERVRERTRELEDARVDILRRLARAAEYRDDATGRHQERVGLLAERIAVRMGVDHETIAVLRLAAPLHDVGKIAISDDILHKPGPLTAEQYARMQEHTRLGAELLSGSAHKVLEVARVVALSHHERWDGRGYPAGRAGEDIPLVGRIVAVADVFDSLSHQRPYKEAIPMPRVLAMIRDDAGKAFDPDAVRALEALAADRQLGDLLGD
jgi:putative two-component system response regulator